MDIMHKGINMFEIVEYLCRKHGVSIAQMCRDTDIRQSVISELKSGRTKSLSTKNMVKIANYFQISTDVFYEGVLEDTLPNSVDMDSLVGYRYLRKENETGTNEFSNRIKHLRTQFEEAQEKLAEFLGITRAAYTNIENGKREPDFETIKKLANHFSVTIDYLLGNEKSPAIKDDDEAKNSNGERAAEIIDRLPPAKQEEALNYLRFLAQQDSEKK